jgi:hypothetical protein
VGVWIKRLYWQATALALAAYLTGWVPGIGVAIVLSAGQVLLFAVHRRSLHALEVQVRLSYLGLLLVGLLPGLGMLHLLQLLGVNALLVADYCPMARLLVLAPWNRDVPLSMALVRWVLLSPPAPGSILDRLPDAMNASGRLHLQRSSSRLGH